jgi:hypothetical protein
MAASLLVAVMAIGLAAAIIAVGRQPEDGAARSPEPAGGVAGATASTAVSIGSTPLPSVVGAPRPFSTVLTVDEHRIGLLDARDRVVTRVIGAPDVVAFPSPFDRSLRLGGPSSGLCIASTTSDISSLALELHLGELGAGGGRLVVSFAGRATGLALDLSALAALDRSAWYGLTVTAVGATGRAALTDLADDRPLLELELAATTGSFVAAAGEVCLLAEMGETGPSVSIDNVGVGS